MNRSMQYKISHEIPEIYYKCHKQFGVEWDRGIIITYGDTIYYKLELSDQKLVHEAVHVGQQTDPVAWWKRYLEDPGFRLSQELEAYQAEAKFLKQSIKDRNKKFMAIRQIAQDLSGPIYGFVIDYNKAFELLK